MWMERQAKYPAHVHTLILTLLVLEWDLLSPLRCLWDDNDEDDEEEEGGRECVGGKVMGTAVLPSRLRELLSLLLRWRPVGSSDKGESKGGRSFLGCFFEELFRKTTQNVSVVPEKVSFTFALHGTRTVIHCPQIIVGSPETEPGWGSIMLLKH